MDAIDYRILMCLKENARQNASNIGQKINLSTSAVIERIKKLENAGVIRQYTIITDQKCIGRELTAFINVRLEHPKHYDNFVDVIKRREDIAECYYIAGDFDFLLKIVVSSGNILEEALNFIKSIDGVSLTRTTVVLSTNKQEVCLLPET